MNDEDVRKCDSAAPVPAGAIRRDFERRAAWRRAGQTLESTIRCLAAAVPGERILWALLSLCAGLSPNAASAQTKVSVPFLAAEWTAFNTDAPRSPYRQVNFMLPAGPGAYPNLTSVITPTLSSGGDPQSINPTSSQAAQQLSFSSGTGEWISLAMSQAVQTKQCGNITAAGAANITVNCTASMFVLVADNLQDELDSRIVPKFSVSYLSYSDEEAYVKYHIQGGQFDGQQVTLHGQMAYASGTNPKNDPSVDDAWVGHMLIALNFGADPLGTTNYLLIDMTFTAGANTGPASCLPMTDVCNNFYGGSDVASYFNPTWQSLMAEIGNGQLYLSGAIPELLYLYDFSGAYSMPPSSTVPPQSLTYDTICDTTNATDPGYTALNQVINQYDAGPAFGLPVRFGEAGGNACGPTALGMDLYVNGAQSVDLGAVYNNTTPGGLSSGNNANGFDEERAEYWLAGQAKYKNSSFASGPPITVADSVKYVQSFDAPSGGGIPAAWQDIDRLLFNKQPVEVRTDLGVGAGPGGGHMILLMGISFNPDLGTLYGTSGNYYIVADPAGHFFANQNGNHYDTVANLINEDAGMNFGGWFGMYPKELLQSRISDTANGTTFYCVAALTLGAPFHRPVVRVNTHSPVALIVTDPLGRQVGALTNGTMVGTSSSAFFIPDLVSEEEGGSDYFDPAGPTTVEINDPIDGVYKIQLTGTGSGSYSVDQVAFNAAGAMVMGVTNSGTTIPGQQTNYVMNVQIGGAPSIQFMSAANGLALFWATNAAGYSLQSSTNLNTPTGWTTVPGPFSQTNGVFSFTNVFGAGAQFYRLKH